MDHLVEATVGNEMMRLTRRANALNALHEAKSIEQSSNSDFEELVLILAWVRPVGQER
jgi:hypothetical protein